MKVELEQLQEADARSLYEFECKNRSYFETMVPSRGDDYYGFESFKKRHSTLLDEQAKGEGLYYLIKNAEGLILGRMNLVDIDDDVQLAYIGYRVGEEYTGKGIANEALKLLLGAVGEIGIKQISAKTTTHNIGSQKVLEKNGFEYVSTSDAEFMMNGLNLKFIYYMWSS
ncbi:ribosomal-protein-alanine N-acetyltransferase [Pelagirhabdus alkalitolerans]|uniref:Ribosomal-protein-alanine N-acetyltransferase n=1 Tax=Pelagirhabdus alkalitolerans TaxID=1612202 RepID=A0A1G6JY78_9BACI|nr:ribosomal-protein-alanine N-acetyltransferase [Pelagirhabdus alkalitolerans]